MARSPLTPARRARLEKLAAYLEGLPKNYRHFEMRSYFGKYGLVQVEYARKNGGLPKCGTVACAVGHGPAAGILVPSKFIANDCVDWNGYSGLFVGDWNTTEYDWCFDGSWANADNHHWGAAARIRYLLDHGRPPQKMAEERETSMIWIASRDLVPLYAPYRIDAKERAVSA